MQKTVWFMKGYSNLYHAIGDIKRADVDNQFKVLCSHDNKGFIGFESADYVEIEPKTTNEKFLQFCEDTIKKYNVSAIFISNKQTLLNKNKARFKALGAEVVTAADYKMINSINNKGKLYNLLKDNPIVKIPKFEIFSDNTEFKAAYKKMKKEHSQLCMKPVHGVYGVGFYVLKERTNQLSNILTQSQVISVNNFKKMTNKKSFKTMMLMQFLEGYERSVDCVAYHGEFIGGVIRKKISGNLPQVIEDNPALIEQVKFLTKKLKLNGMYNIQFRDSGGEHYLLEINPRLSGRSFYATLAGLNLPYIASLVFTGLKKPEEITYELKSNILISAVTQGVIVQNDQLGVQYNSSVKNDFKILESK
jgi:predicted ATP-grasp superfamily ATP-dependent carboligase